MNKKLFAKLFAIVLAVCVVFSLAVIVSSAADGDPVATFELGADGSASHKDGSTAKTDYSETDGDYTLSITGGNKMYPSSIDGAGNGSIKFGSSSAVGSMSFTVPDDVTSVILYVAKYKTNTSKITVNGTAYTLTGSSNNGAYDAIEVDTTTTKTISFTTVSGGYRVMLNTIEFYAAAGSTDPDAPVCEHANQSTVTVDAECTVDGSITVTCDDCGAIVSTEKITAPGHIGGEATCEELAICDECGEEYGELAPHNFVDGACTACGEEEPAEATITFNDKSKRTEYDTSHQVWVENGITVTNNKDKSTTNVADYANPARFYKNSTLIVTGTSNIQKIVFITTSGYTTALGDNSVVDGTTVTVNLDGTSNSFTAVLSAGQVRVMSITVYYVSGDTPVCEHTETETVTENATCHTAGSVKEVCVECGTPVSSETIPAAHTFANGVCSVCNLVEAPKAGVPYKFGMYQDSNKAVNYINGGMVNTFYFATSTNASEGITVYLEETDGGYYMYSFIDGVKTYINMVVNGDYVNAVYNTVASTVYTIDETKNTVCSTVDGKVKYFGTYGTYTTVGTADSKDFISCFYAAGDVAKFNSASVTLGTDLGMIFKTTVPAGVPTLTVEFNGKTYELTADVVAGTIYSFNFKGIGPHQLALNIKATLYVDGVAVAEIDNYSVEENLNAIKSVEGASADLIALVNSVLIYGSESEKYLGIEEGVNADDLTNDVAENEATYEFENAETFGFTAVGVNFDAANKIYVKFFVKGEFTLTVNGNEVAVEKTEDGYYKVYTDALTAKQFADEYTFVITVGNESATLTYSVNAYAAAMKGDAEMGALAEALYAYGVNAKAYAA